MTGDSFLSICVDNCSAHIVFLPFLVITVSHIILQRSERRKYLRERVKNYLTESAIPKTIFCKRLGISTNHLYAWLKGERNISDELSNKIKAYLDKYAMRYL